MVHFAGDLRLMLDHGMGRRLRSNLPKSKLRLVLSVQYSRQASVRYNKNRRPEKSLGASGESNLGGVRVRLSVKRNQG